LGYVAIDVDHLWGVDAAHGLEDVTQFLASFTFLDAYALFKVSGQLASPLHHLQLEIFLNDGTGDTTRGKISGEQRDSLGFVLLLPQYPREYEGGHLGSQRENRRLPNLENTESDQRGHNDFGDECEGVS